MRLRPPSPRRLLAPVTHPVTQVGFAFGGVIGGAALIGRVALGVAIVLASLLVLWDGLFRDDAKVNDHRRRLRSVRDTHAETMENYRRAP